MRKCSRCGADDKRLLRRDEPCTCGAGEWAGDADHKAFCQKVGHHVVQDWPFPVVLRVKDLVHAPDAPNATHGYILPPKFRAHWRLVERPNTPGLYARVRTLCRPCIIEEQAIAERVRDYEKSREKFSGREKSKGWAALVAMQDSV